MNPVILKTYFYSEHEYKFLNAMLFELYDSIDRMILCEFDIHHTGQARDFIFDMNRIDSEYRDKVEYHACKVQDRAVQAYDNENLIHRINEPLMRSYFTLVSPDITDDTIVLSVDADEVIYKDSLDVILENVRSHGAVGIPMHQFFYKPNYLWKNKRFQSASAFLYGSVGRKFMNNWRDVPRKIPQVCGGHYSWCMSVDQMIKKLHSYSHPRYRFCAKKEILENAIENKSYPFDPSVSFEIKELDWSDPRICDYLR